MHPHIDNREVVVVIIVNLHDNPKGSGTKFVNNPFEEREEVVWYEGPTKKHRYIFSKQLEHMA